MKLFNKSVISYFHYLRRILNDDSFKEYINPVVFINLKYIYFVMKKFLVSTGYSEHLQEAVTERCSLKSTSIRNMEILYLLNALKELCKSTIRKHALLWNKHEYQHTPDMFVKNIFNPFYDTRLFLYSLKYIRKSKVSWCFRGHRKRPVSWNRLRIN